MSNPDKVKHLSPLEAPSPETKQDDKEGAAKRVRPAEPRVRQSPPTADKGASAEHVPPRPLRPKVVPPARQAATSRVGPEQSPSFALDQPSLISVTDLPSRRTRRPLGGIISFILCVILPTVLGGIYYFGIASPQYEAGFHFSVRDTSSGSGGSVASATSILATLGMSTASNPAENYMVVDYILSRQAIDDLQAKIDVKKLYSEQSIDWWSRFNEANPLERFVKYWQHMVTATYDEVTGTGIVNVRAFAARDAYDIATALIALSEDLVNETAQQPQREAVRYAEGEVKRAEERLKKIRGEIVEFRNKSGLVDPTTGVVLGNATLATTLRTTLAQIETDLSAAQGQRLNADAPQIRYLKSRQQAVRQQIAEVEGEVNSAKLKGGALSEVVAKFEQLELERGFAQNMLTSTMQSYEQARSNAMAKRIFITPYVRPVMPQASTYPNRLVATLTVAGACFLLWTIGLLLARSIREHLA